uniref:Uncharacterized protein n=1 Tax=Brassica oleracea TaxID=3712 RepID=A0A3P6ECH1_BRAOL|nr:unnamed protein product [Brassica oleracea]
MLDQGFPLFATPDGEVFLASGSLFMGSALVVIGLYGKVKQQHTVKSDFKDGIESRLPVGGEGGASTSGCGNGATRLVSP